MIQEYNWRTGTAWPCVMPEDILFREWLNTYEGKGRYYLDGIFNQVYFECDEDRAMFLLRFS